MEFVAYCGLDCKKCFAYLQTVSEAAKGLRRILHKLKLKQMWKEIPFLGEYEPFKKSLDGLAMLRCTRACRGGGGNPWCKIRICCRKRELAGCWDCGEFLTCRKLHKAYLPNLKRIKRIGLKAFMAGR